MILQNIRSQLAKLMLLPFCSDCNEGEKDKKNPIACFLSKRGAGEGDYELKVSLPTAAEKMSATPRCDRVRGQSHLIYFKKLQSLLYTAYRIYVPPKIDHISDWL